MKALNDLSIFVETSRQGSFSVAANRLNLTPAAVSAAIKRLEQQINFPLFVRSTRSLRLTGEGETFLAKTTQALELLQDGISEIMSTRGQLSGLIQLAAPSDLGRNLLLDWIAEFTEQHPLVKVKLELTDSLADMYTRPVDIAIRYGQPADSNLVAMPLCTDNFRILCASPAYIAQYPPIKVPQDLLQHNCLCFMLSDSLHNKWTLKKGEHSESLVVSDVLSSNDSDVIRRLACKGKGVAQKSLLDVSQDIISGQLRQILPQWRGDSAPLYMLCADRRLISPIIRQFQTFLQDKCRQQFQQVLAALVN
tara:strand:+ start:1693 stop:2616 length:924 start_codon:yes stop_codon:yes gene_type:complete